MTSYLTGNKASTTEQNTSLYVEVWYNRQTSFVLIEISKNLSVKIS